MKEDNYDGGIKQARRSGIRPFLPVLGFLLASALGAISYSLGEPVTVYAQANMGFEYSETMVWVFRVVIFVVLLGIAAALFAAASPKPKTEKLATEKQLAKEKFEKAKERELQKKRHRESLRKMHEENKKKQQGPK